MNVNNYFHKSLPLFSITHTLTNIEKIGCGTVIPRLFLLWSSIILLVSIALATTIILSKKTKKKKQQQQSLSTPKKKGWKERKTKTKTKK